MSRATTIHWDTTYFGKTECGLRTREVQSTRIPKMVTCKHCRRSIESRRTNSKGVTP